MTKLDIIFKQLNKLYNNLSELWKPVKPYLEQQMKLKHFYLFYLKNIQNKKFDFLNDEIKNIDKRDE